MAQQQRNSDDNNVLWTFLLVIAIAFGANWFLQEKWKYARLVLYKWYVNAYDFFFGLIGFTPEIIERAHDRLNVYEPIEISKDQMNAMASDLYPYLAFPFVLILMIIYFRLYLRAPSFNRTFTRKSLVNDQKHRWKWLYPIADLELEPEIEKGEWAMAKRPLDFMKKYQLLDEHQVVIEEKSSVILSKQLGSIFNGYDNLKDYEKALLIIFTAHSEKSKEGKNDAVKWLSILSATHANQDYSWLKEGWEKYKNSEKLKQAMKEHAYVKTILLRMLEEARGVLPTSYFIWLKTKDRTLYFSLNCLGRREHFIECAGVINHFFAEKELKKPIYKPYVVDAIKGLKDAVASIKITKNNYYDLEV